MEEPTTPPAKPVSAFVLMTTLDAWFKRKKVHFDPLAQTWYTNLEWKQRGEKYGENAPVSMIIDGSDLYMILNHPNGPVDTRLARQFGAELDKLGYYYEMGTATTLHFYAIEPLPERPAFFP